jgi:hypothetical protein
MKASLLWKSSIITLKNQHLANNYFADVINTFNDENNKFLSAIINVVKHNKQQLTARQQKTRKRGAFMKLLDKL